MLLTRFASPRGLGIVIATAGKYSHAALWLPVRTGEEAAAGKLPDQVHLLLAEADGAGTGFTDVDREIIELKTGERVMALPLPDVMTATVLRHPALKALGPKAIFEAAELLQKNEFHFAYSRLPRLASVAHLVPAIQPFLKRAMRRFETPDESLLYGAFCSELVAKLFEYLNLSLFFEDRPPDRVSPGNLSKSRLNKVAGAVLSGKDVMFPSERGKAQTGARQFVSNMVRWKSQGFHIDRQVSDFNLKAADGFDQGLQTIIRMRQIDLYDLYDALVLAEKWRDQSAMMRFQQYAELMLAAQALNEEVLRRRLDRANKGTREFNLAEARVSSLAQVLSDQAKEASVRTQGLMALRYARAQMTEAERDFHRKRILVAWAKARKTRATVKPWLKELADLAIVDPPADLDKQIEDFIETSLDKAGLAEVD